MRDQSAFLLRTQINRILDPLNRDVSIKTQRKAAEAIGRKLRIELI